jgi:hypothetical protein
MRKRATKMTLITSLAIVLAAIVTGAASAGIIIPSQQASSASSPSDSAAFPGGGTVSVLGVNYPKGPVAPAVGMPQSGPSAAETQKSTVALSSSGGSLIPGDAAVGLIVAGGVASVLVLFSVGVRRSKATHAAA